MNVKFFKEGLDLMYHSGFRLADHEAALIENSLIILQHDNKFQDIFFIGRVETETATSYYIAMGYARDILEDRRFFYSLNGYEWVLLPNVQEKFMERMRRVEGYFRGDPAHVEMVCMDPTFISDPSEVFITCPSNPKKLKEEDRLACFVHRLITEAAIMPRGILYRQISRIVSYNPFFRGLSRDDASDLKNYQLFRFPRNNRNYNLTKREDYNYQTDFFDTIDDLVSKKCFSLRITDSDVCIIRSLRWPGMIFYHKLNTPYQGFCYLGNGRENLDLLFMM